MPSQPAASNVFTNRPHGAPPVDPKKMCTVYIGNVHISMTEQNLGEFFNQEIPKVPNRPRSDESPVKNVQVNHEKMYAFVEFHSPTDSEIAVAMDGIRFMSHQLRIRRPKNFESDMPAAMPTGKWQVGGVLPTHVEDGPHKIFLGGLPMHIGDSQVISVCQSFGELSAFTLVKDRDTGGSKGYAFMSFRDPSCTQAAIAGINGCEMGGKVVSCKLAKTAYAGPDDTFTRASMSGMGSTYASAGPSYGASVMGEDGMNPNKISLGSNTQRLMAMRMQGVLGTNMGTNRQATEMGRGSANQRNMGMHADREPVNVRSCVLMLLNMVTPGELADPDEYADITEDIRGECAKFGRIVKLIIPTATAPDAGKIFIEYDSLSSSARAMQSIAGRAFAGRTAVVTFVPGSDWKRILHQYDY